MFIIASVFPSSDDYYCVSKEREYSCSFWERYFVLSPCVFLLFRSPFENGLQSTRLLACILFFFFLFLSVIASSCNNLLLVDFDVSLSKKQQYANIQIPILFFFPLLFFLHICRMMLATHFLPMCVYITFKLVGKISAAHRDISLEFQLLFLISTDLSKQITLTSLEFFFFPGYASNQTMAIIIPTCSLVVLLLIESIVYD